MHACKNIKKYSAFRLKHTSCPHSVAVAARFRAQRSHREALELNHGRAGSDGARQPLRCYAPPVKHGLQRV